MNKIFSTLTGLMLAIGIVSFVSTPSYAINVFDSCSGDNAKTTVCNAKNNDNASKLVQDVINTLLYVVGVVSVIMIIVGGIRYASSNGEASQITTAKNTVFYSVVGLVVALTAYTIVNFVVGEF